MNKKLLLTISSIAIVMLLAGAIQDANAAGYIKIGDIKGESTDDGHKEWINLLSVAHSIDRSSTSSPGSTGATFGDLVVVKEVDASTPKLQEAIARGTHFPSVMIDFTKSFQGGKQVTYLQWELKNAIISKYSFSGAASNDPIPTDQISLNFEEIKVTYTKFDKKGQPQGTVEYTWNVKEGES